MFLNSSILLPRLQNPNQHRMQHMRMAGPNCQMQPIQMGQPRMAMVQANRMSVNAGHEQLNQQNQSQSPQTQGKQQQQHGQPPPPPYPIPPPPYPGNSGPGSGHNQVRSTLNAILTVILVTRNLLMFPDRLHVCALISICSWGVKLYNKCISINIARYSEYTKNNYYTRTCSMKAH